MGLLNRLFGSKKRVVEEVIRDIEQITRLWADYIRTYDKKVVLIRRFDESNLSVAEKLSILEEIESLISRELVDISEDKKTKKEILADLKSLVSKNELRRLEGLKDVVYWKEQGWNESVQKLLKKLLKVLQTELQVIRLIKANPERNLEAVDVQLYELIYTTESKIYYSFSCAEENMARRVSDSVHKVLAGEKQSKSLMPKLTKPTKPIIAIKSLTRPVYEEILELTKEEGKLDELISDEKQVTEIILEHYPRAKKEKIQSIINAVRYFYENPDFINENDE